MNHLAPVALTRALLPSLRANRPARIVNVGSLGQVPIDFDDLGMDHGYDGIAVNCLHPATFMATAMVTQAGINPLSTVDEGGEATLRLIVEDVGTGGFFDGQRPARAHPDAYDPAVRARLREATGTALAT